MIYVECKADLLLIRMVASISLRDIIHEGGKSEVLRRLEKQSKAVGLIDEDPWAFQSSLLKRYFVERSFEEDVIRVLKRRGKVLIVLCPRLEEWTLEAARKSGIKDRVGCSPSEIIGQKTGGKIWLKGKILRDA